MWPCVRSLSPATLFRPLSPKHAFEERLRQAPQGVRGEPDGEGVEEPLAEAVLRQRRKRPFAARGLAAVADRQLQREHADEGERRAFRHESYAGERG